MPKCPWLSIFAAVLAFGAWPAPRASLAADAPGEIAGFRIGEPLAAFAGRLRMDTAMPIRHLECLKEVEVEPPDGFKSGMLYYGTCAGNDLVLRVKMKYADPSRKFYEALLDRFKDRFGEPDQWKGDPFHVVIAWKWFFADAQGRQVSLILQHNTRDVDEKIGNSVKLTASDLMEEEKACFRKGRTGSDDPPRRGRNRGGRDRDWDALIPQ